MQPAPAAAKWNVPAIESVEALADWLALTPDDLAWFADLGGFTHRPNRPRLAHYRYRQAFRRRAPSLD